MKVLIVTAEAVPFAKTGGLADVCGALPRALRRIGIEADVALPFYGCIDPGRFGTSPAGPVFPVPLAQHEEPGSVEAATVGGDLHAFLVRNDRYFHREFLYGTKDGDYVDIIVSMLFVDVDPNFQSIKPNKLSVMTLKPDGSIEFSPPIQGDIQPSTFTQGPLLVQPTELQRPRLVMQTTVKRAYVVHVGNFPLDGSFLKSKATPLPTPTEPEGAPTKAAPPPTPTPPIPDIITLAISPQDATELLWYLEARIPFTMVLRNPTDESQPDADQVSLSYITSKYNISQPLALPYALEPALRSIRPCGT